MLGFGGFVGRACSEADGDSNDVCALGGLWSGSGDNGDEWRFPLWTVVFPDHGQPDWAVEEMDL